MPLSKQEVFDYIKGLSSGELSQFITELQEELGVTPPMPQEVPQPEVIVGGYHPVTMGMPEYDVYLTDLGSNKLHVLKVLREMTGLGLLECKALANSLPKKLKESLTKNEAERIAKAFEECGVSTEIRPV